MPKKSEEAPSSHPSTPEGQYNQNGHVQEWNNQTNHIGNLHSIQASAKMRVKHPKNETSPPAE